jgi:peptidoglycan/xylan/chitin deacetylase (PgdA/CDA1 family)
LQNDFTHVDNIISFYEIISNEKPSIKLLEYPSSIQSEFNPYQYYQSFHGKRVMYGYIQSHALKKQWNIKDIFKSDIWLLDVILSRLENNKINFSRLRHFLGNTQDMYDINKIKDSKISYIILHNNLGQEITKLLKKPIDLRNPYNARMIKHAQREAKHLYFFYRYYFGEPIVDDEMITVFKVNNKSLTYSPKAIVTFQFDHPFISQYTLAKPLFAKKGIKGTLMVNTDEVGKSKYFMTWEQLKEMYDEGWEIGSHSVTHPDMRTLNEKQIRFELSRSKKILKEHGFTNIINFAYPYNWYSLDSVYIISEYYRSARTSVAQTGFAINPENLRPYELSGYEARLTMGNVNNAMKAVDEASEKRRWLIFILHELADDQQKHETMSVEVSNVKALEELINYIQRKNIPILKTEEAFEYYISKR